MGWSSIGFRLAKVNERLDEVESDVCTMQAELSDLRLRVHTLEHPKDADPDPDQQAEKAIRDVIERVRASLRHPDQPVVRLWSWKRISQFEVALIREGCFHPKLTSCIDNTPREICDAVNRQLLMEAIGSKSTGYGFTGRESISFLISVAKNRGIKVIGGE